MAFDYGLTWLLCGATLTITISLSTTGGDKMKNEYITFEQADKLKRRMPKSEVAREFESYIKELPQGQVGQITVDKKDSITKTNTTK